ncbi:MAG: hypothetical protein CMH55_10215 [Myxococcales bacterium]|nr:hypothetical protein [Myxococcales bacterium]
MRIVSILFAFTLLTACASEHESLQGTWSTNFDTEETITEDAWGANTIDQWDASTNTVIVRTPDDAEWSPGTYSKIIYTDPVEESFYYCIAAFGKETAEAALNEEVSVDDSDPDNAGCGDFAWTKMTLK